MKTILITGGAGFIGSNLVRRALATTDASVVVLDKLTYAGNLANLAEVASDSRFAFVKGDIADRPLLDAVIRDYRPDAVMNLAAESHVDRSIDGPRPFVHTNVLGTFELLEASRAYLAEGDDALRRRFRFLHVSTDEVYGSLGDAGLFTEETPYAPNSPYSASKASADHLVRAWHHTFGLPALMTNCSNNYGPYQFPEKLIPLTILNAVEGRHLPIYGDGLYVRDWLYVEDHCDGLLLVLREGAPGGKYNLGGHSERANLDVVDRICDAVERYVPAAGNPALSERGVASYRGLKKHVDDRAGHDRRYAIDTSKVARELRWSPTHRFETAIDATVKWYLDHRDWCRKVQDDARYGRERLGAGER